MASTRDPVLSITSVSTGAREDVLRAGRLWRVCRRPHADLSGVGAARANGRWHTRRSSARVMYCSGDPSTAILEVVVKHLSEASLAPPDLVLATIRVDHARLKGVGRERVITDDPRWARRVRGTRACGDDWLARAASVALIVPSALSPAPAVNVLINASHPAAARALAIEHLEPLAAKIADALAGLRAAE